MNYDVVVIGAGPAGSAAALAASGNGCRVALLDRSEFPRHKVCGDCVNPGALPILKRLGALGEVLDQPHAIPTRMVLDAVGGKEISLGKHGGEHSGYLVTRRSAFDHALVKAALRQGVDFFPAYPVLGLSRKERWEIQTAKGTFSATAIVAADGRNSSVAGMLLPTPRRSPRGKRIGLQCHTTLPPEFSSTIRMFFFPHGYGGVADCGDGTANVCLAGESRCLDLLKREVGARISIPEDAEWKTIAPLERRPITKPADRGVFFAGDAARVVEPFTGEGIFYALQSGELAGIAASSAAQKCPAKAENWFLNTHRQLYVGKIWPNFLTKVTGRHPRFSSAFLRWCPGAPRLARHLFRKVLSQHSNATPLLEPRNGIPHW